MNHRELAKLADEMGRATSDPALRPAFKALHLLHHRAAQIEEKRAEEHEKFLDELAAECCDPNG